MTKTRFDPQELRRRIYPEVKSRIHPGVAWSQTPDSVPERDGIITPGKEAGRESRVREILTHGSTSGERKRR
jgi:hypothetical protein